MRVLLKVSIPTEKGNAMVKDGSLVKLLEPILDEQKPEAAYFTDVDGLRTMFIVVNLTEPSQIPAIAEPYFLAFNATVDFHPAMVFKDLAKAGPSFKHAVEKYG